MKNNFISLFIIKTKSLQHGCGRRSIIPNPARSGRKSSSSDLLQYPSRLRRSVPNKRPCIHRGEMIPGRMFNLKLFSLTIKNIFSQISPEAIYGPNVNFCYYEGINDTNNKATVVGWGSIEVHYS